MFENNKKKQKRKLEKELKKYGKYGHVQWKHSKKGIESCWYAGAGGMILFATILIAYMMHGESVGIIGGLGILPVALSILGIRSASSGFKERERDYSTCRIGMTANIIILLILMAIFVGGVM